MPKLQNTRRQRAQELLKTVTRGPLLRIYPDKREYAEWAERVIAELKKLIPELRVAGKPRLP